MQINEIVEEISHVTSKWIKSYKENVVKMANISNYQMLTVHYNVPASDNLLFKQQITTF